MMKREKSPKETYTSMLDRCEYIKYDLLMFMQNSDDVSELKLCIYRYIFNIRREIEELFFCLWL